MLDAYKALHFVHFVLQQLSVSQMGCLPYIQNTVELQWLEHRWLVYHGYFELDLESLGKHPIAADIIILGIT